MQKRRNHTEEFQKEAVCRWEEVRNFNQVGRELDISSSLVRKWKNQLIADIYKCFVRQL